MEFKVGDKVLLPEMIITLGYRARGQIMSIIGNRADIKYSTKKIKDTYGSIEIDNLEHLPRYVISILSDDAFINTSNEQIKDFVRKNWEYHDTINFRANAYSLCFGYKLNPDYYFLRERKLIQG